VGELTEHGKKEKPETEITRRIYKRALGEKKGRKEKRRMAV